MIESKKMTFLFSLELIYDDSCFDLKFNMLKTNQELRNDNAFWVLGGVINF